MDRLLLEVYCPTNDKTYEFWISKNMNIGEASAHIASEIAEFEQNAELFDRIGEGVRLYWIDTGKVLPFGETLLQFGIHSGQKLMIL